MKSVVLRVLGTFLFLMMFSTLAFAQQVTHKRIPRCLKENIKDVETLYEYHNQKLADEIAFNRAYTEYTSNLIEYQKGELSGEYNTRGGAQLKATRLEKTNLSENEFKILNFMQGTRPCQFEIADIVYLSKQVERAFGDSVLANPGFFEKRLPEITQRRFLRDSLDKQLASAGAKAVATALDIKKLTQTSAKASGTK